MILLGIPGPWQIGLILLAILLFFGAKKFPSLMKGIGQGVQELNNIKKEKKKNE